MNGIIRLICEEPQQPPAGQEGEPVTFDLPIDSVTAKLNELQQLGWTLVTQWSL